MPTITASCDVFRKAISCRPEQGTRAARGGPAPHPGEMPVAHRCTAMAIVMFLQTVCLSVSAQTWENMADYQPNNQFQNLEITDAKAEYIPFYHDPKKPNECMNSRVNFSFTVTNKGKQPQKLPRLLRFETNSPKPWMRRTDSNQRKPEEDVSITGSIQIRSSLQVDLKPGESTTLTTFQVPPDGPWNPMNLEVRLADMALGKETWVGARQPYSRKITVDAPDYISVKTTSAPADGKKAEEARRWKLAAYFDCVGKRIGGPVTLKIDVKQLGSEDSCLLTSQEYDNDAALVFLSGNVLAIGKPDFDRVIASIRVGCPIHKFQTRFIDANPSNDSRVQKRVPGDVTPP